MSTTRYVYDPRRPRDLVYSLDECVECGHDPTPQHPHVIGGCADCHLPVHRDCATDGRCQHCGHRQETTHA